MSSESRKQRVDSNEPGVDKHKIEIMKAQISNLKCNLLPKEQVSKKLYAKVSFVDQKAFTTSTVTSNSAVSWADTYPFEVPISSSIIIQVCQHRRGLKDMIVGKFEGTVQSLFEETSNNISRELWKTGAGGVREKLPADISFSLSNLAQDADIARLCVEEARLQAHRGLDQITTPSMTSVLQGVDGMISQAGDAAESFGGTWESVLDKLTIFTEVADVLSEVHPYAQTACSILSAVPKALIAQKNRDDSVYCLMKAIDDIYSFVDYAQPLEDIKSHRKMLENMSRLTMEASYLIRDYTIDKNFWKRFAKLTFSDVDATIKQFNDQFEQAKKDFAKQMDVTIYRCLKDVESRITQSIILDGIPYAAGAGYDPDKSCIPGTRSAILADLHDWINRPDVAADGSGTPRILVLAGVAGCGKSAIAHTIAQYYHDTKRLGSSFCFSQADQLARGPGNVLSTIAKDIANLDPQWKLSLFNAVQNDDSLRKSTAPARQMKDLILEPAKNAPITGPTVIVIDALDESGETLARKSLIQVLSKSASELPGNFRILITTRPEEDIIEAFDKKLYVELRYMDAMDKDTTHSDIAKFIQHRLSNIAHILEVRWPNGQWVVLLVNASDHLFQWAATACRAILDGLRGYHPTDRLNKFVKDASGLDNLYIEILCHTFDVNDERVMSCFKRVFGGILTAKEPLSIQSHSALQRISKYKDDVQMIVQPLGSLLHGTTQSDTPIRTLHASFLDFLKDPNRSKAFFVDPMYLEQHFFLACLGVMKAELQFNICNLPTSHLHNTDAPDMRDRVRRLISPHLLYSCRFLGTHLEATPYESRALGELQEFLHERLLFWLEVLSLTEHMNIATKTLASIATWGQRQRFNLGLTHIIRSAVASLQVLAPCFSKVVKALDSIMVIRAFAWISKSIQAGLTYLTRNIVKFLTGLLRRVSKAARTFVFILTARIIALILKSSQKTNPDLTAFARDAIRFVNVFMQPISQSAPHIYLSALPFAPSDSIVSQTYLPRYPFTMRLKRGKLSQWPAALKTFEGHKSGVYSVAYSPDGTRIVSGSSDNTVCVWDAETGMVMVGPLKGHTGRVICVAYSPDGKRVASGSEDETIRVWDAETGEMLGLPLEGHNNSINCIAYSPNGKHIASGSGDETIRVWDAEAGEAVGSPFEGHTDWVRSLAYSPDGKRIASGCDDKMIRVWDAETGEVVGSPLEGHTGWVLSIAYSPDGKFLASSSYDCTVRVWDAKTGKALGSPLEGHSKKVYSVAYFPDGKRIVSGSFDSTIRIWDAKTGHAVGVPLKGHGSWVRSIACSPDGTRIASGSSDTTIRVWDAEIADSEAVETPPQIPLRDVWSVAYSPDGASIVSGDLNGVIQQWDVATGKAVGAPFEGHSEYVNSIAYSPDGTRIASGSTDKTMRVWDVKTGKEVGSSVQRHYAAIRSVAYSPDGKYIVSGSWDETVRIWDTVTGEVVLSIEDCTDAVFSVAYSPDGTRIATGSGDCLIQIWDTVTGEAVGSSLEGHSGTVLIVAYSPDGKRIASGSADHTIRVWDAETGELVGSPFTGHTDEVNSIAYSPDGKSIASASDDCTIRIWDADTGVESRAPFKVHLGQVTSVAFSPDREGTHIVSGSRDNTIRIWEVNSVTCTSESDVGFRHDSRLDNGWIMTPSSELLLWVPSWYRLGLVWPNNKAVIAASLTELELSNFVHGSDWQQCRNTLQIAT